MQQLPLTRYFAKEIKNLNKLLRKKFQEISLQKSFSYGEFRHLTNKKFEITYLHSTLIFTLYYLSDSQIQANIDKNKIYDLCMTIELFYLATKCHNQIKQEQLQEKNDALMILFGDYLYGEAFTILANFQQTYMYQQIIDVIIRMSNAEKECLDFENYYVKNKLQPDGIDIYLHNLCEKWSLLYKMGAMLVSHLISCEKLQQNALILYDLSYCIGSIDLLCSKSIYNSKIFEGNNEFYLKNYVTKLLVQYKEKINCLNLKYIANKELISLLKTQYS